MDTREREKRRERERERECVCVCVLRVRERRSEETQWSQKKLPREREKNKQKNKGEKRRKADLTLPFGAYGVCVRRASSQLISRPGFESFKTPSPRLATPPIFVMHLNQSTSQPHQLLNLAALLLLVLACASAVVNTAIVARRRECSPGEDGRGSVGQVWRRNGLL
jgi:hypothetical protein